MPIGEGKKHQGTSIRGSFKFIEKNFPNIQILKEIKEWTSSLHKEIEDFKGR